MRKLASVREVKDIKAIEGADNIELVLIDGWQCVSKKNEFKQGDKCIYFEIDSFLSIKEEYEFLRKSCYKNISGVEGFRIRTIKLKGQISQGLVIPCGAYIGKDIGYDLTEILDVLHYDEVKDNAVEILKNKKSNYFVRFYNKYLYKIMSYLFPKSIHKKSSGNFPSFIRKTDQERIQNINLPYGVFEVTEKLDGSSATFYLKDGVYGFCSRNMAFSKPNDTVWGTISEFLVMEAKLKQIGLNIAIQGEIIAPNVQGNPYGLIGTCEFYCFDIFDIDKQVYYNSEDRVALCRKCDIPHVPIVKSMFTISPYTTKEELHLLADNLKSVFPKCKIAEGIVFKDCSNGNNSFKVVSNKYLLSKEK